MGVRFTWDPIKAARNLRAHGVSFESAMEVFDDPHQVVGDNYFFECEGEQRYQIIGMTRELVLLLVVFVEPSTKIIRLISARKADNYEKNLYTDQFR